MGPDIFDRFGMNKAREASRASLRPSELIAILETSLTRRLSILICRLMFLRLMNTDQLQMSIMQPMMKLDLSESLRS